MRVWLMIWLALNPWDWTNGYEQIPYNRLSKIAFLRNWNNNPNDPIDLFSPLLLLFVSLICSFDLVLFHWSWCFCLQEHGQLADLFSFTCHKFLLSVFQGLSSIDQRPSGHLGKFPLVPNFHLLSVLFIIPHDHKSPNFPFHYNCNSCSLNRWTR